MHDERIPLSRRELMETAGAAALGRWQAAGAGEAPSGPPRIDKLSDNLFRVEDTCNVYVIREGRRAALIDFGAGKVLDLLPKLGVARIDWILHTHHHRDQCQGDPLAAKRGIPIAVPEYEHHLFTDVENFWRNRRVFHEGYETRNDYFSLTASIPVAAKLRDYEHFAWGGRRFFVLPTPGHTLGSVTLLTEVDGRRVAFTGDLLHGPGKVLTLYDMQLHYGNYEGADFSVFSLGRLLREQPDLVCPSHGDPLWQPEGALRETQQRLAEFYRFATGLTPTIEHQPFAFSPHLVVSTRTSSTFYAIVSDSGKALLVDYGFPSAHFSEHLVKVTAVNDRSRFLEHNLEALHSRFRVQSIDVAIPTHANDDHYCGFPYLIRRYGTKIWCLESMVEVFENPWSHRLGCILPEPIRIDRAFRDGETFRWEEYEFTITHNPGHAEHQLALFVTIDGKRIGFTGDAYSHSPDFPTPDGSMRIRPVFLNHFESDSYQKSIRTLRRHRPEILAPGHGRPFPLTEPMLEATQRLIDRHARFYRELIADPDCDFGLDATWVKIVPYQMVIRPGEAAAAEVRVRNYRARPVRLQVSFALPPGWRAEPQTVRLEAPPKGNAAARFRLLTSRRLPGSSPRFAIAADVIADGKHLGQIAEAVVNLRV